MLDRTNITCGYKDLGRPNYKYEDATSGHLEIGHPLEGPSMVLFWSHMCSAQGTHSQPRVIEQANCQAVAAARHPCSESLGGAPGTFCLLSPLVQTWTLAVISPRSVGDIDTGEIRCDYCAAQDLGCVVFPSWTTGHLSHSSWAPSCVKKY